MDVFCGHFKDSICIARLRTVFLSVILLALTYVLSFVSQTKYWSEEIEALMGITVYGGTRLSHSVVNRVTW